MDPHQAEAAVWAGLAVCLAGLEALAVRAAQPAQAGLAACRAPAAAEKVAAELLLSSFWL